MQKVLSQPGNIYIALLIGTLFTGSPLWAEPVYHPSGAQLTFGGMTHRSQTISDMGNPAHPASRLSADRNNLYSAGVSLGSGIEYDGNDNLFKLLDELGSNTAIVPGGSGGNGGGGGGGNSGKPGSNVGDLLDPAAEARLLALVDEIGAEAAALATFVTVATTGLNAKAFLSIDAPVTISNNFLGGSWAFRANNSVIANLHGLTDPIEFNTTVAQNQIQQILASPPASTTTYDLSGGASVTIDPATGETTFRFENDTAVITRATQITEISIGYSRKIWSRNTNKLYIGVMPKYYNVGLLNEVIDIDGLTNSREILDRLKNSSFTYTQDFGIDIGAIWSGKQYQIGATLSNLNEPTFHFPRADLSNFTNPLIIGAIRARETYTMKRQLKLEAGYITRDGAWGINFGLDANPTPDPMGDNYQWLSVSAGYASDNWWLPGARFGLRNNLAGTALTYITGGITVFNIVNLDLAATTDTITVSGTTLPQGFIGNISINVLF